MSTESTIERIVMRRVHTIRILRPLVSQGAIALIVFMLALWGIGREVWVARVFENIPQGNLALDLKFFLAAFENTRVVVQALSIAVFASILWFFRGVFKAFSYIPVRKNA